MKKSKNQRQMKKAYEKYVKAFTPKTGYISNGIKAFLTGGCLCAVAFAAQELIADVWGLDGKDAGTIVTVLLILIAQVLTGLGLFAPIAKFAGAGVIVPITGFANSMVSAAMEFKSEGPVLGVGSKLFQVAGPVIVSGLSVSVIIGIVYCVLERLNLNISLI